MPISLATRAITGAAPVPVPPPMPAVMNSMCAPSIAWRMRSTASSAAALPASGLAPAPRPVVPSWIRWCAAERLSACASVLAQMKSTPCTPSSIMCSTALPPPPPTPITLICVPMLNSSIISIAICCSNPCSCLESLSIRKYVLDVCRPSSAVSRVGGGSSACGSRSGASRSAGVVHAPVAQKLPRNQSLARPNSVFTEPACCAARWPRVRARRASSSRPITVAERGLATMSCSAPR